MRLSDIAYGGECLGRIANQVVFAGPGIPGEEVMVEITADKKSYRRGKVVEVLTRSPARVEPRCPLFGRCGGCHWQHVDYPAQIGLKRQVVKAQLLSFLRKDGFGENVTVNPTLDAANPWHYRNNARFATHNGRLGFRETSSHRFLGVPTCPLMHPAIDKALASWVATDPRSEGDVTLRFGENTGQLLTHQQGNNTPASSGCFEEEILGRRFRISASSFFQVNSAQASRLVQYAIDRLEPQPTDTLLDIYCGVGTFGLLMANKVAKIIGVEASLGAVADARFNARNLENVEFFAGQAEDVLPGLMGSFNLAIIDPPRAGCKRVVVETLKRLHPDRIVYVSCDPATLARDLRLFCADGQYRLRDVQPVDMFPQTYHVETVATLQLP
ncbi:MAG: 23S rRNA (uracil(1939)-C(5))-methyltransferase RlmD [Chloroflexi bacterium]|nr:23S rRNA (uracil(1939)-C(5))-methyltransferase RlmD [Chloroflexota bacterium]